MEKTTTLTSHEGFVSHGCAVYRFDLDKVCAEAGGRYQSLVSARLHDLRGVPNLARSAVRAVYMTRDWEVVHGEFSLDVGTGLLASVVRDGMDLHHSESLANGRAHLNQHGAPLQAQRIDFPLGVLPPGLIGVSSGSQAPRLVPHLASHRDSVVVVDSKRVKTLQQAAEWITLLSLALQPATYGLPLEADFIPVWLCEKSPGGKLGYRSLCQPDDRFTSNDNPATSDYQNKAYAVLTVSEHESGTPDYWDVTAITFSSKAAARLVDQIANVAKQTPDATDLTVTELLQGTGAMVKINDNVNDAKDQQHCCWILLPDARQAFHTHVKPSWKTTDESMVSLKVIVDEGAAALALDLTTMTDAHVGHPHAFCDGFLIMTIMPPHKDEPLMHQSDGTVLPNSQLDLVTVTL